jgi:predicted transcriptional regulator
MDTLTNGSRFLAAFNDVENHLRDAFGHRDARHHESFVELRRKARQANMTTTEQDKWLETLGKLRNAIVHGRFDKGRPLADPVTSVVERMEALRDVLLTPPTVAEVIQGQEPVEFQITHPLSEALRFVRECSYSQFPLREGERFVGLLSTNAIARWLAHQMDRHGGMAESELIAEVLKHRETTEQALLVGQDCLLTAALERLSPSDPSVLACTAIGVTQNGHPHEETLGLITHADVPDCVRRIQS